MPRDGGFTAGIRFITVRREKIGQDNRVAPTRRGAGVCQDSSEKEE